MSEEGRRLPDRKAPTSESAAEEPAGLVPEERWPSTSLDPAAGGADAA